MWRRLNDAVKRVLDDVEWVQNGVEVSSSCSDFVSSGICNQIIVLPRDREIRGIRRMVAPAFLQSCPTL